MSKKPTQEEIENTPSMRFFLGDTDTFRIDYEKFKKKSKQIGMIMYSDEEIYDEKSRIVCDKCTKTFFDLFFQEYTEQETEMDNVDPIIGDILKQKVFMSFDAANKQFVCPQCGNRENLRDTIIDKPDKKLTAAGMNMYPEYDRYTKEGEGDFIGAVNKFR